MDKPFTISSVKGNGQDYDQDRDFVLCALSPASQQSKGILAVVSACFFLNTRYMLYHLSLYYTTDMHRNQEDF